MQDVQNLARHAMRGGYLGQSGFDLFQVALPVPEKPGDGLQGSKPGLCVRCQPHGRRVAFAFSRASVLVCRHFRTFRTLPIGRKAVLDCFGQVRLEFLKFLVYVLGPLD
ncbi:hypothetical protein [Mesorhizobium sp. LNHC232B00]|uniref:hypothetical protein n=1 Tax=Mesorhizobium sp. LNHC232B00 TaxID=1287243 RepID=UPI0003CEB6C5|nr:hypothetical protein [Mesorhizobium sp. LNHC232B00]ESY63989.1 hypothetical protein X742_27555 [Mesorhizobium sp. LNHC232B00]